MDNVKETVSPSLGNNIQSRAAWGGGVDKEFSETLIRSGLS